MEDQTINNPALHDSPGANPLDAGYAIWDQYVVQRRLEAYSGEADLYLCQYRGKRFVARVYRRKFAIRPEDAQALRRIESVHVARLVETGTLDGFPVEILPYFQNGSLQGRRFEADELMRTIIPNINEGLHALHRAGILHKHLKPSNIMLDDDGRTAVITNPGIRSSFEGSISPAAAGAGAAPEYAAPETFRNVYDEGSDYYAFGITLYELFCGHTPHAEPRSEENGQAASAQPIPFPEDMPARLRELIAALTYCDSAHREDKSDPNRRWTYEEVCRCLRGEPLAIPDEDAANAEKRAVPAYPFMGKAFVDTASLAAALAINWEEGKRQLCRGQITAHFRAFDPVLARKCQAAEEEAARKNGKDDLIYWQLLYQLDSNMKGFYWKESAFESLTVFGKDVLERLWDRDASQFGLYDSVLSEKLLSRYLSTADPQNEESRKAAEAIEDAYELEKNNGTDGLRTYYLMADTLSGQKLLLLNGQQFRTVGELAAYMRSALDESFAGFKSLCHRLVDYDGNPDPQLEAWLLAIGKQRELEDWRASMNE